MGGVPKQRKTKSRRNQRRMHIFVEETVLTKCKKCGKSVIPHVVCSNCGYYKGIEVINVLEKLTKKEKKQKERELKAHEKEGKKEMSMEELSKK
ncbi:50S ribosomal protein L32 [Patescibacteria group bacterium]